MSREWRRLPSTHFTIVGSASPKDMAELAVELETFLAVLQQMTPSLDVASPVPTYVFALKDRNEYNAFQLRNATGKREKWVAGYFSPGPDAIFMVMPWSGSDDESLRLVLHEFTHHVASRGVSGVPLWVAEGVAEFYSTFHIDKKRGLAVVGEVPRDRVPALYLLPLMPLERLTAAARTAEFANDPKTLSLFYSQSWALVHYLFVGNRGARTKQIGAYVRALGRGEPRNAAFSNAFGGTYEQLRNELVGYVTAGQFPYLGLQTATLGGTIPDVSRVEPIPVGEAAALQAMVYVRVGAVNEAGAAFARAQTEPPASLQARIALDRVRVQLGLTTDAAARYDELVAMTKEAAAAKPLDAPTLFHLSLAAMYAGREDESDAALNDAFGLIPEPDIYRQRAYMAFALGRDGVTARDVRAYFQTPAWWHREQAPHVAFLGALALRRLHAADEAAAILDKLGPWVHPGSWTARLFDYMQGKVAAAAFLGSATNDGERTEAHTYVGFDDALAGRRAEAIAHFRWVKDKGSRNFVEYPIAVAELKRLEQPAPR
jgi:tetratricopeptide (TPR) repeat protein